MGVDGQRKLGSVLAKFSETLEHLRPAPNRYVVMINERVLLVLSHPRRVPVHMRCNDLWHNLQPRDGRGQDAAEGGLQPEHRRPLDIQQRRTEQHPAPHLLTTQACEGGDEAAKAVPRDKHRNLVPPVARGRSAQRLKVLDHDLQIDEGARAIAPAVSHGVESMDGHPGRRQPFKHPRVTPHVLASERRLPVRERRLPVRERRFCEGPNRRVDESTSRRIDDERAPRRIRGGNTKPP
mmetsp:Transcript_12533/g.35736  ORF Transcript_12533/g.35736 Transcript_12533/m.35736 type:complete len:237 (-) Transcript_12533:1232-1942(-)